MPEWNDQYAPYTDYGFEDASNYDSGDYYDDQSLGDQMMGPIMGDFDWNGLV